MSDEAARERILTDLDTNLLVEAGAGSGKTTGLVGRMLAHVERGDPVDRIAAVTFTRKAATELRERFEVALEQALRKARTGTDAERAGRLARAREDLDRAFIGTIHSFCGRLLRENPLEAGLDPAFEEIPEEEWPDIQRDFWNRWLERSRSAGDPALGELRALGIDPRVLFEGFQTVVRYPDVEFPAAAVPAPSMKACAGKLAALLAEARAAMPAAEPDPTWDGLQRLVRRLSFLQHTQDWSGLAAFCGAIGYVTKASCAVVQKRWSDKPAAKARGEAWRTFMEDDAAPLLTRWREHRYAPVMRFLAAAAAGFARERRATGRLGFEDLLLGAAGLLRGNARARRSLGLRYRYLLVDEFQDTDPIQAEVCFLLASEPDEGDDWRRVRPRPGALFVVGDPKQSIYRFRRADIQTYELVKQRIAACGEVLQLTRNFRSVTPIGAFVDNHFSAAFPPSATQVQAAFAPLETQNDPAGSDGCYRYVLAPEAMNKQAVVADCSSRVASWIAGRIGSGDCVAEDFLVLAFNKRLLADYARALAERNVPVSVTGAPLPQELELRELVVVLRALADPANSVLVAAALEGMFIGCSPADLYEARVAGADFSIAHRPTQAADAAGVGLQQLHEWWITSQRMQPDLLLERIFDDTGLLAYAASLELGDNRAGTLLHVVEALRSGTTRGASSLTAAITAIEGLLANATNETPLRPGRADAVRVMNLHKAKGLEARIVVLVAPTSQGRHDVESHVRRAEDGTATGGLVISAGDATIAQPVGWAEMAAEEERFLEAERQRLLYVAATRAERELVVAQLAVRDTSIWHPLAGELAQCATVLQLDITAPPGRRKLEASGEEMNRRLDQAANHVHSASRITGLHVTVTESAKAERELQRRYDVRPSRGQGVAWGRAVHRAIEAMGRGRTGASLEAFVRAVVIDEQLHVAIPDSAGRIMALLARLRELPEWATLQSGGAAFECPIVHLQQRDGVPVLVEGVMDAAVLDGTPCVFDWKTDNVDSAAYQRQVEAYGEMLSALGGHKAGATLVALNDD